MAILRLKGVMSRTGHGSHSTIYDRIKRGLFPRPVSIGSRAVGWPESEVEAINTAHIAGADENAIRALVERLHKQRAIQFERLMAVEPPTPAPASNVIELGRR